MAGSADSTPSAIEVAVMALRAELVDRGYVCSCELPAVEASVRFLGPFHGREVAWNMTLCALQGGASRSFMEIAPATDGTFGLTVGLNLTAIDGPAIKKTLIMVRNFKRLELGRHEWGETPS